MTDSYVSWLIHMCDVTPSYDSLIWDMTHSYETWLTHMRHDSRIRRSHECWYISCIPAQHVCQPKASRLIPISTLLHPARHDSFIIDMTQLYETRLTHMRHDSPERTMHHIFGSWLIHKWRGSFIWDMTHLRGPSIICMTHDSFIRDTTHSCETWLTWEDYTS